MLPGLEPYLGTWENADGNRLSIRSGTPPTALVSFYAAPHGEPIHRPWWGNRLSIDMVARNAVGEMGSLEVELADPESGFSLFLTFEPRYDLDAYGRDALVPALSEFEGDGFLRQYSSCFGSLHHYTKLNSGEEK